MPLPQHFLEALRAQTPVSQVVGRRVSLTKRGREHVGLCPFHNEKTPSFTVNDDKGFYHCFGCGAHGDVVSFVMQSEGASFVEATRRLAEEAGIPVPAASPGEAARERRRASLLEVLERGCRWFEQKLREPVGNAARAYLANRGIDDQTIARFRLGYAPAGRGQLAQALRQADIDDRALFEVGLLKPASGGGPPRDYFFDRVIFPIADHRGRVIAFGARALGDRQPKYLNSPDNDLFHKGKTVFNLSRARAAVRSSGEIIVVEGYMDVIALDRAGFPNAVAPMGTALTDEQLQTLWRAATEPIVCFDGDAAGGRAALRAAERALPLLIAGRSLRFVALPEGEDPDSLVRERGPHAMQAVLSNTRPLVDMIWQAELQGRALDTPERRAALERALQTRAAAIRDPEVQRQYRAEYRRRYYQHIGGRTATWPGAGHTAPKVPRQARGLGARGDIDAARWRQECALLAVLIRQPRLLHQREEALSELTLQTPSLNQIFLRIRELSAVREELDTPALERHLMEHGLGMGLETVMSPSVYRQVSFAAPGASVREAAQALDDILAWHRRGRLLADRTSAERDLAHDMTDENSARLLGMVREQVRGG